ncbi:GntR family transcriptional regulator [Paenibacillus thermotolerans]|uniref:GntR family transcriptional regulator n=1 Tax=Paenibacillus thermotolerans TaxID=3027807 RepID=UPI0023684288|nr:MULTISPECIES: GntR family transcriptional regulator [unclassified Paenibacillus]
MNKDEAVRTPLYKQIRDYVLDHITRMDWQPNDKIPSENELAAEFNVSRITIKNALKQLVEEGLIYRIQGKGSFVSPKKSGEEPIYKPAQYIDKTVAYLVPRSDNRFTANLLNGIENELSEAGYRLLFCETKDSQELEIKLLKQMVQIGVKGIIIYPAYSQIYNEELLKLTLNNFPVVVVDRYIRGVETNYVCSDNVNGAYQAAKYLIELGHSKIGFVSTYAEGTTSIEDRIAGYEKALHEHNIPVGRQLCMTKLDPAQVNTIFPEQRAHSVSMEQIKEYLSGNPDITAVIAANSAVGMTLLEAAKQLRIRIPDDLSVIFLDDFEMSAFSAIPPTVICQEEYTVGREAAKMLLSIANKPRQPRNKAIVQPRLIVRESTAPPRKYDK